MSVDSNSSLSFEVRGLKFAIQTIYINTKKVAKGFFQIRPGAEMRWFFKARPVRATHSRHTLIHMRSRMLNFSTLASKLREKTNVALGACTQSKK